MKYKAALLKLMKSVDELGLHPCGSKWGRADYGSMIPGDKAKKIYDTMKEIKAQLGGAQ